MPSLVHYIILKLTDNTHLLYTNYFSIQQFLLKFCLIVIFFCIVIHILFRLKTSIEPLYYSDFLFILFFGNYFLSFDLFCLHFAIHIHNSHIPFAVFSFSFSPMLLYSLLAHFFSLFIVFFFFNYFIFSLITFVHSFRYQCSVRFVFIFDGKKYYLLVIQCTFSFVITFQ